MLHGHDVYILGAYGAAALLMLWLFVGSILNHQRIKKKLRGAR